MKGRKMQMYIDITRGTPEFYRTDALDKALKYIGPGGLIFGSDSMLPGDLAKSRQNIESDRQIICRELGWSEEDLMKIARDNLEDFLKPME
jgi:hypothetical protein